MEKFNANQIEQFLFIGKEVTGSADHIEVLNRDNFWGDHGDTVSGITLTTTLVVGDQYIDQILK